MEECLKYLELDLLALLEVVNEFNKFLHTNYNINLTESLTISKVALNIFLHNFYDPVNNYSKYTTPFLL